MLRKILAGIAGIFIANATFIVVQSLSGRIFGMPGDLDMNDPTAMARYVESLPASAFVLVLAGYALGCYLGGFAMFKIAKWDSLILPLVLGVMGTIGWTLNVSVIPQPTWMVIAGFFCFIPFALLGYRSAR